MGHEVNRVNGTYIVKFCLSGRWDYDKYTVISQALIILL